MLGQFWREIEPPALPCMEDVVVENGATAPKSYLSPLEMSSPTAAGDLLRTSETSTAASTTFHHSTLWFCQTEETILRTSTPSVRYYSSFWRNNLIAAPSCRRIIDTTSGHYSIFDPGGSEGRLRACPFLGTWRVLLCGGLVRFGAASGDLQRFLEERLLGSHKLAGRGQANRLRRMYYGLSLFLRSSGS